MRRGDQNSFGGSHDEAAVTGDRVWIFDIARALGALRRVAKRNLDGQEGALGRENCLVAVAYFNYPGFRAGNHLQAKSWGVKKSLLELTFLVETLAYPTKKILDYCS